VFELAEKAIVFGQSGDNAVRALNGLMTGPRTRRRRRVRVVKQLAVDPASHQHARQLHMLCRALGDGK